MVTTLAAEPLGATYAAGRAGLLFFLELRLGDEIRHVVRAAGVANHRGELSVDVLELIRRRFALQADQVFGLIHQEKDSRSARAVR